MAQIAITRKGQEPFREARTFPTRRQAESWAKKRETELATFGNDLRRAKNHGKTLGDAIQKYIDTSVKEIGRTKTGVLNAILEHTLAEKPCASIRSPDIVKFAEDLSTGDRTPATVNNYLSHLSAVFAIAKPAWGLDLDPQAMKDAFAVCNRLGITGKSRSRSRRPTLQEIAALMALFQKSHEARPTTMPMHIITAFAIFSTRRQEEIARLTWDDFDPGTKRIWVRDMKHPGDKMGNDVMCDLPDPAADIIEIMPRNGKFIFPYNSRTFSARFTRACKALEIEDLRFHDLRHDGVSRLFEIGLHIPQAAAVSGHRSWASLQRYTHFRKCGDKYAGAEWLDAMLKP